jgi:glycosyltransferase involved in cell wall biosynthesis
VPDSFQPVIAAICIPVRNEAALLPRLFDALVVQESIAGTTLVVCFLLDGCDDGSAALIADFARRAPWQVQIESVARHDAPANAGRARRCAMAMGEAVVAGLGPAALLTTDADSEPATGWVAACCRGLVHSDVVAGHIVRGAGVAIPAQDRLEAYYDRLYWMRRQYDPVPWDCPQGHHMVGGANLAFRAEAYRALGGFAEIAAGEDSAIVDKAHRLGLKVRRDRSAVVTTSTRRHGRAIAGLADHLRCVERETALPMVAHLDDAAWQYRGHAAARASHARLNQSAVVARLASLLQVEIAHVERVAAATANAEAFATHVVPAAPGSGRTMPLDLAEDALTRLEHADYEHAA